MSSSRRERQQAKVRSSLSETLGRQIGDGGVSESVLESAVVQDTARRDARNRVINLDLIDPDPNQPRTVVSHGEEWDGFVQSIREHGVIAPITVRLIRETGRYEIIAGERRYTAARAANLSEIPAIIRDIDDTTKALEQLVENLQREDMNPVEEGLALNRLIEASKMTQAELAQRIGKSRDYVAKLLSLPTKLTAPEQAQLRECAPAHIPSKSLILEALRTDDFDKRQQILFGGMTRAEARKAVTTPKTQPGRKKNSTHRCRPVEVGAKKLTVTVASSTSEPLTTAEIAHALELSIHQVTEGTMDELPPVGGFQH